MTSLMLAACGGVGTDVPSGSPGAVAAGSIVSSSGDPSPPKADPPLAEAVPQNDNGNGVIATKSTREYVGHVDVLFLNATNVRWNGSQFSSDTVNVAPINGVLSHYPQAIVEQGIGGRTADQLLQAYRYMEQQGMKSAYDWNGYYKIHLEDEAQAEKLVNDLSAISNLIESAQIKYKPIPLGFAQPTPDLTASQDYIKPFVQAGGLNITAMWAAPYNLSGESVNVSDQEDGAYFGHEELVGQSIAQLQQYTYDDKNYTQHGTAVAGIMAAKKDTKGITGIASTIKNLSTCLCGLTDAATDLSNYNSGAALIAPYTREGDVIITTSGKDGPKGSNKDVPFEWTYVDGKAMKQLVEMGVTIIEATGNTSNNFDDPAYDSITKIDSGAIFVGASQGGNLVKADFSNCGKRVDVFAWGQGVLTSGYGDYGREPLLIVDKDYLTKDELNVCFPTSWWAAAGGFVNKADGQQMVQALCAKNPLFKFCAGGVAINLAPYRGGFCPAGHTLVPKTLNGKQIQTADDGGQFFYDTDPATPEWNIAGKTQWYTNFNGTSASTPIIGGGVVLLQEYVRKVWNADGIYKRVYLTSQQVREILKESGKGQGAKDTDDPTQPASCPIGVQPDFGKALQLIDQGWCPDKVNNKCAIPQIKCFPPKPPDYSKTPAVAFDMDGDKRADLIAFSKDHTWHIDLSSTGPTYTKGLPAGAPLDNFGTWNITLPLPANALPQSGMFFPVVGDYNSDGQSDLAIYDSANGKWYIKYTTPDILAGKWGAGWDRTIDYSKVAGWKAYSRPAPGDYDGDGWMDIGLVTPDGHWLMDYGKWTISPKGFKQGCDVNTPKAKVDPTWQGWDASDNWGNIDKDVPFLTAQQLQQAPGWSYLPVGVVGYGNGVDNVTSIYFIMPDGISNAGTVKFLSAPDFSSVETSSFGQCLGSADMVAPGSVTVPDPIWGDGIADAPSFKDSVTGQWSLTWIDGKGWKADTLNLGDIRCRSIPADYDGGGTLDRATFCSDTGEWKIAYSSKKFPISTDGLRHVSLPPVQNALPAFVYPGGVSFQDIKAIFESVDYLCPTVAPGPSGCTIDTMSPIPIGPYFPQCVDAKKKQYAADPCLDPNKKVACETMHIQQAQCVWQ